jgi:hypothetical protein
MKFVLIGTLPMFLLFGAIAPACAQPNHDRQEPNHDRQEQDKSGKQRSAPPQQHAQPAPQQQHAQQAPQQQRAQQAPQQQRAQQAPQQQRPQQAPQQHVQQVPPRTPQQQRAQQPQMQQRAQQQPQRTEQQARAWQQQSGWSQQGAWQQHATWQQNRSSHWQTDHRTWGERGGYGGYYIPQDRFGLYFGAGHWFRIQSQPIIFAGYPRFQYGAYSFLMVDPWPGDWAPNWYATDDVYVGYSNGYYLYNRMHPGEAMAITVVL